MERKGISLKEASKQLDKKLGVSEESEVKQMKENKECWVTAGYGCPYKIGNKYWDTYKCPFRNEDSPCMREVKQREM